MLQFGIPRPHHTYAPRPTAFGILVHEGRLACVRIDRGEGSYLDLPGGARDGDESEPEAVVREFREETGLRVAADVCLTEAAQFVDKSDGRTVNNTGGFWTLRLLDPTPSGKIEDDHELVWLDLVEALASLRHEAHAWAVAVWLRSRTSA
ncbi:NUDIX domain-containing protein [Brevundimonas halotolerans]|uniref:8-oxo-dGTP diphosphatase n=1 Tax=Brevundimonas halotolerans TaxID=69670 RepID=A0A7W9A2Q0_9CAUL|nr:NUDIX domain-containing protein [Brevundimonas halotolerans]MBB5660107.1 8-oxo-dGTP diphosphatase [Brevundimonas halotolerans]